jgi:hypothetical protein
VDDVTAIIELGRESICALLLLVLVPMLYHQDKQSRRQRGEIERMVREILRNQNGRGE